MDENYDFVVTNDDNDLEFRSFRETHYQAGGSDKDNIYSGHESEAEAGNYFSDEEYKSNDEKKEADYDPLNHNEGSDFNTNNDGDYDGEDYPYYSSNKFEYGEGTPQSNAPVDNENMEWSSNYNEDYPGDEENYDNDEVDDTLKRPHHHDDNQAESDIQQSNFTDLTLKLQAEDLLSGKDSIMEPRITEAIDRLIHMCDWTPEQVVTTLVQGYTGDGDPFITVCITCCYGLWV